MVQFLTNVRVSVVGLGRLGAPLAAVLADREHEVTGIDRRPDAVEAVNAGRSPIDEPALADLIGRNGSRLRATTPRLRRPPRGWAPTPGWPSRPTR
ncbi:MAG: hypothetical protein A3I61_11770 [Acidobacteria bacterium RIFCSPLOWO2_02_FULL_68_18]|nr:MAG: hypothetical protein A3I61_11770 [Acidobacteria bacterium RIFCSPLOWO2_02_FULL_68_18]